MDQQPVDKNEKEEKGKPQAGTENEHAQKERRLELKVGAFVLFTLLAGAGVVLLLGQKSHLFEKQVVLHAAFTDVQGLKAGAPVRLSGVDVGLVSRISFASDHGDTHIQVDLEVSKDALSRIGGDSVARIGSQGLLGDKIIEVSIASPSSHPLAPGDNIQTVAPADLNRLVEQAGEIFEKAKRVADNAAVALDAFADKKTIENMQGSMASVRRLLKQAEQGPGLAHAVFYDQNTARKFNDLVGQVDRLVTHVDTGVKKVDSLLNSVDSDGLQVVNNISRAARSVGDTATEVRKSKVIPNLERASADLADMTGSMKAGRGTLGALVMDSTVYEQLVTVLGGVARSRVLRGLVRYAISRDDDKSVAKRVIDAENGRAIKPPGKLKAAR